MLYNKRTKLPKKKMNTTIVKTNRSNRYNNSSREVREKLHQLVKTTRVRIFKNDPITWIPQDHVSIYKREITWHLYELTQLINMECWSIIVEILFKDHSPVIFSLVYQLSSANYHRSTLPLLTANYENYNSLKKIASIFDTNIILYKPNYIPQYLKVSTHYINVITSGDEPAAKDSMVIYSQPIECLYSLDYRFQLGALTDLRFEEDVRTFFDMSKCLIDIRDFDNTAEEEEEEEEREDRNLMLFKQESVQVAKYKAFVALWCESENSNNIPDEWWPYPDNRSLTIQEFVLLLIKVSTTYSGTGVIIYKSNYYCICGDSYQAGMMVCQVHDDGHLDVPDNFQTKDLGTKYKRDSLLSLVKNNKNLYVY